MLLFQHSVFCILKLGNKHIIDSHDKCTVGLKCSDAESMRFGVVLHKSNLPK